MQRVERRWGKSGIADGFDSFVAFHVCCSAASQSPVCSPNFLLMKKKEHLISTPSVLLKLFFFRKQSSELFLIEMDAIGLPHVLLFLKRTTRAFNKHVIRRKTAGSCITDGAVLGISKEETTHTDGSLFQHLLMHIAQNFYSNA